MNNIKADFPILKQMIHGKPLVYLDSANTSQKPNSVLNAMEHYYSNDHSNVHRGITVLSGRATERYENTRKKIQMMLNAEHVYEIIFTSGTTESINLVANSYGRTHFETDSEVIVSTMEHHSNIVPWQLVGAKLKVIPITDTGVIDLKAYASLFSDKTKLVAITHASNVLGTINPIKEMIQVAHARNVPVLVDGAQAFSHMPVDVQDLECDFYTFSAHKAYGPTGVGILYGKKALLKKMAPFKGGGAMIESVTFEKSTFAELPSKFEAGTPNIANVVGFHAALEFIELMGIENIVQHEQALLQYTTDKLSKILGLTIIGTAAHKVGVISFILEGVHPHDIATILDHEGISVRAGHHCAMPLMERYRIPACARVSLAVYNTLDDIDLLCSALEKVRSIFHV